MSGESTHDLRAIAELRSLGAVRARARALLDLARAGRCEEFAVVDARLDDAARAVADEVARLDPERLGAHGRLAHLASSRGFAALSARLAPLDAGERAAALVDLVVPSVLLDAGAGAAWRYACADGRVLVRSEGLAAATLAIFASGGLAADGASLRCDAEGLARLDARSLGAALQVDAAHPLVGLEGRAALLGGLGRVLVERRDVFGAEARPGGLVAWARGASRGGALPARTLFALLVEVLAPVWCRGARAGGTPLGDVWSYPALGVAHLVPFHKLTQWLVRSLVQPLGEAGVRVEGLDELTSLADYRNGGLLLDVGVLVLRDPTASRAAHPVEAPLVVAWRALTVALLDEVAPRVAALTGRPELTAALLEPASWAAGRRVAAARRAGAVPPLEIASDGTVF